MKNHEIYPQYLCWLDNQLIESKMTKGKYSLFKLSKSYFNDFIERYENEQLFRERVMEIWKSDVRDQKIDDIFDDFDL